MTRPNAIKISLPLLIIGGYLLLVGYAYSGPLGRNVLFQVPLAGGIVDYFKGLPYRTRKEMSFVGYSYTKNGLLPFVGGAGAALILAGLVLVAVGKKPQEEEAAVEEESTELKGDFALGKDGIKSIDTALGGDDEGAPKSLADDAQRIISMSHAALNRDESVHVISEFRKDLESHLGIFEDDAIIKVAQQILRYQIIRLKRQEKSISASQFKLQDARLNETERETICRRFMPSADANIPQESTRLIGRVFSLVVQSELQQKLLSDSTDWADLSLRNVVDVIADQPLHKQYAASHTSG